MSDANLLEVLNRSGKKVVLENIVLYGKIRCAIKEPDILSGLKISGGMYAIVDVFALRCLGENYFGTDGYSDINGIYFTKGSMIICIDNKKWIGKSVKVYGSSTKRGVKVKQQWGARTKSEGIIALQFSYNNGDYYVVPNKLVELGAEDRELKGTVLEDVMLGIVTGNLVLPKTLDSIKEYEGVSDYIEISDEDLLGNISSNVINYKKSNERIDVTKIDLHLTYHLEGAEKTELYDDFQEEINNMSKRREDYGKSVLNFIKDIYDKESEECFSYSELGYNGKSEILETYIVAADIKRRFIENIAARFNETIGDSTLRGYYYVGLLTDEIRECNLCTTDDKEKKRSWKEASEELYSMVQLDPTVLYGVGGEFDSIELLNNNLAFSIAVIGITTGIDIATLVFNLGYCNRYYSMDINLWFYSLIRFPYALGMFGPGLSLVDCDVLYFSYSRFYSKGCLKSENADMRCNMLFLESLSNASNKDTLISPRDLQKFNSSYPALGTRYLEHYGFPAKGDLVEVLKVLLSVNLSMSRLEVDSLKNVSWYSLERQESLIENGLVNSIDELLILENDLEKEFLIYKVLIDKGHKTTGLTDPVIEGVIKDFEEEKGFQLEKLQKDGIHLTKYCAAVLSGCAGSGKTTTSDCMTEALKKLDNFDKRYEIIYCTPTGKACRRLAEVVRGTVKTINSQFGVGIGGSSYMANVYMKAKREDKIKIYLMDEMAMCSMSLLYEICRNLNEEDIIYFLGDCKQLPPIGKGNPFALLMKLLPCIELGVSKRAAEGSDVNYNTTLVNCVSDGLVQELSYNNKDFFKVECSDAMIPMEVAKVWKKFMSGEMNGVEYSEDDIQVITGYQKETIPFSAPQLNKPLQKLLRSNDPLLFRHTNRDFYLNDRVIHVKLNSYSMNRYVIEDKNTFRGVVTFGIVNGEIGRLVGVFRSDMVHIYPFSEDSCVAGQGEYENVSKDELDELIKKREERDDFRDDARVKNNRQYFVCVQVYDVELQKDVCVLYTASSHIQEGMIVLEGTDLGCLDLAYALTTHKMQGSQSPVVICAFGSSCNPNFINRNMINTMFTRSQEVVCNVGSVEGVESPITKGRMRISPVRCNDALSILVEG